MLEAREERIERGWAMGTKTLIEKRVRSGIL